MFWLLINHKPFEWHYTRIKTKKKTHKIYVVPPVRICSTQSAVTVQREQMNNKCSQKERHKQKEMSPIRAPTEQMPHFLSFAAFWNGFLLVSSAIRKNLFQFHSNTQREGSKQTNEMRRKKNDDICFVTSMHQSNDNIRHMETIFCFYDDVYSRSNRFYADCDSWIFCVDSGMMQSCCGHCFSRSFSSHHHLNFIRWKLSTRTSSHTRNWQPLSPTEIWILAWFALISWHEHPHQHKPTPREKCVNKRPTSYYLATSTFTPFTFTVSPIHSQPLSHPPRPPSSGFVPFFSEFSFYSHWQCVPRCRVHCQELAMRTKAQKLWFFCFGRAGWLPFPPPSFGGSEGERQIKKERSKTTTENFIKFLCLPLFIRLLFIADIL